MITLPQSVQGATMFRCDNSSLNGSKDSKKPMARAYVRIILILIPVIAVSVFVLLRQSQAGDDQPAFGINIQPTSGGSPVATEGDTVDQPGGSSSRAGVGGTVNFTVRDGDGNVIEAGAVPVD